MFAYVPQSSGATQERGFLPQGFYPASVIDLEEGTSKSGNAQLIVTLKAVGSTGFALVNEYLVNTERAVWKIDRFMAAIGRTPEPGKLTTIGKDIIGSRLYVKIMVEHGELRDFSRCEGVYTVEDGKALAEQWRLQGGGYPQQGGYAAQQQPTNYGSQYQYPQQSQPEPQPRQAAPLPTTEYFGSWTPPTNTAPRESMAANDEDIPF